jgi:hypothetical protein
MLCVKPIYEFKHHSRMQQIHEDLANNKPLQPINFSL